MKYSEHVKNAGLKSLALANTQPCKITAKDGE